MLSWNTNPCTIMICRKLLLGFLFLLAISFNANARNTPPFANELDSVPVKERYGDFLNKKILLI
jgi:hypothetical protein